MNEKRFKFSAIMFLLIVETFLIYSNISKLSVLEIPIGILLVAYIPGSLAVEAFFPTKKLRMIEQFALSMAISAVLILTIPYAMSSFGIVFNKLNLVYAVDVVVVLLLAAAMFRRGSVEGLSGSRLQPTLVIGLVVTVLAILVSFAEHEINRPQPAFYVTGASGKLSGYPFDVVENRGYHVTLNIENSTSSVIRGSVTMRNQHNGIVWTKQIDVKGSTSWSMPVTLPANGPIGEKTMTFRLADKQRASWSRTLRIRYDVVLPQN